MLIAFAANADFVATVAHGPPARLRAFDFKGNEQFSLDLGDLRVWMQDKLAVLSNGSRTLSVSTHSALVLDRQGLVRARIPLPDGHIVLSPQDDIAAFWNADQLLAYNLIRGEPIFHFHFAPTPDSYHHVGAISPSGNLILATRNSYDKVSGRATASKVMLFDIKRLTLFEWECRIESPSGLIASFLSESSFALSNPNEEHSFRFAL